MFHNQGPKLELSTISRIVGSLVAPVLRMIKKPWAERTAARNPAAAPYSPIDELDEETLVHLGASSTTEAGWKRILEVFAHRLVKSEPFSLPHVREWLDLAETQRHLQRIAHARITSATERLDDLTALVDSYMLASGEHLNLAENIVDHAVKVLDLGRSTASNF